MFHRLQALALLALCTLSPALAACEGGSVVPTLGAVLGGIDAQRAMSCAGRVTGDPKGAARCLGVEVLTSSIRLALAKANGLAEAAQDAAGPAGADDMTDRERSKLAAELSDALAELSQEVANSQ